jgi:RNA polymerase sigma-70 factor (sigma-E family)
VRNSFEDYVSARGPTLLRFAYVLSGDHHLAEDIVQEVLARMHPRWHRMADVEQPDAYLRRAIVRQYLSWRRRRSSQERPGPVPERPGPDSDHGAERDEVWQLLATLPRSQRAVLVLRFYEDLPDEDIATLLGCARATVRVHASRGLARLRDLVPARDEATSSGTPSNMGERP